MQVTYKEIADAAGVSKSKVEADRRKGLFDKKDLKSVALYIANAVQEDHVVPAAEFAAPVKAAPEKGCVRPARPAFDWET